jgi:hypothetical protein
VAASFPALATNARLAALHAVAAAHAAFVPGLLFQHLSRLLHERARRRRTRHHRAAAVSEGLRARAFDESLLARVKQLEKLCCDA